MIEEFLGKLGLPTALVAVAIIVGYVYIGHDGRHTKHDLQMEIVKVCADKPDVQNCATRLTKTVNGVK
jgi:hypothetical protein